MKQLLEFIPLLVFFYFYKKYNIIIATIALAITSIISFVILTVKEKKLALMPLISAGVIGFFGLLTWYFQDPLFIKIKPTILNSIFGLVLIIASIAKKPIFKKLFQSAFEMSDLNWLKMSMRWGIFFIFLAVINELIWRNFTESFWVSFKVFGFLPLTILFTLSQIPFIMRHSNIKHK